MRPVEAADKDQQALVLFKGATRLADIRDQLGFRSVTSVQAAINRALTESERGKSLEVLQRLESERLDDLYRAVYPAAVAGDMTAVDRALKISEQRARMSQDPAVTTGSVLAAFDRTVEALEHIDQDGKDEAVVATGRALARQIDFAIHHLTGQEVTKALYLVPHLMNVLSALGATPEARKAVKTAAGPAPVSSLDKFRAKALKEG